MNMDVFLGELSGLLLDVALAMLGMLAAWAVYYIRLGAEKVRAQTAKLRDEAARSMLETALDDVQRLVELSVGAMEQTTAKALREAVKNGTASREDLLALSTCVFEDVADRIRPEVQEIITKNLGNFDDYLSTCIENAVLKVKQNDPFTCLPEAVLVNEGAQ